MRLGFYQHKSPASCLIAERSKQPKTFDTSRRGKKGMTSSRDQNEGAYLIGEGGEGPLLGDPGSELRLGREKEK